MHRLVLGVLALSAVLAPPGHHGHDPPREQARPPPTERRAGPMNVAAEAPTTTTTAVTIPPPTPLSIPATVPPAAPAAPPGPTPAQSDAVVAAWTKVADCEEGGWVGYSGPAYPDSLGITAANWATFGGGADLSPPAQAAVGQRMADELMGGEVPDQNGCWPGGW